MDFKSVCVLCSTSHLPSTSLMFWREDIHMMNSFEYCSCAFEGAIRKCSVSTISAILVRSKPLEPVKAIEVFLLALDQMQIPATPRQKVSAMESSRTRSAQYALRSLPRRASCRSTSENMRSTIRQVQHPSVCNHSHEETVNI